MRVEFKVSCLKQEKVTFTPRNVVILSIVYELDTWSRDLSTDFTLNDCLFGTVKLTQIVSIKMLIQINIVINKNIS